MQCSSSGGCDYSNSNGVCDASSLTSTQPSSAMTMTSSDGRHHQFLNATTTNKRNATDAGLQMTMTSSTGLTSDEDDDDDIDDDAIDSSPPSSIGGIHNTSNNKMKTPPANGKKTKGRVKIKMEFIDNKLRRYTTFSKRKTGIMKKAYELSTLTGTQVMLLVASETGHVYTFATRKLQPMITSEAGKALIQTCLNSPDPLLNCGSGNNDDDNTDGAMCSGLGGNGNGNGGGNGNGNGVSSDQRMSATGFEETEFTYSINEDDQKVDLLDKSEGPFSGVGISQRSSESGMSPLSPTLTDLSGGDGDSGVANATSDGSSNFSPIAKTNNLTVKTVQIPSGQTSGGQQITSGSTFAQNSVMMVPANEHALSMVKVATTTPNSLSSSAGIMYQTPQGFLYASPTTTTLPEGVLFNFGQLQQQTGAVGAAAQQYITIPLSLAPASQIVHRVNLDGRIGSKNSVITDLSKSGGGSKK